MNLTYTVSGNGYTILNNGVPWIVQDKFIPYPGETVEESAENHIAELIKEHEEIENRPSEIEAINQRINEQEDALVELGALLAEVIG